MRSKPCPCGASPFLRGCKPCHRASRRVASLTPAQLAAKRSSDAATHARHRDENNAAYRAWYQANLDAQRARSRAGYQANAEARRAYGRAYEARRRAEDPNRWRRTVEAKGGPEWNAARVTAYRAANPHVGKVNNHARRAALAAVPRVAYSAADVAAILARHDGRCYWCRTAPATEIDHIIPLRRGGPDAPANLAPACGPCNRSRGARTPAEWLRRRSQQALAA